MPKYFWAEGGFMCSDCHEFKHHCKCDEEKTKYITLLGSKRKIHEINGSEYVMINGSLTKLTKAQDFDAVARHLRRNHVTKE